MSHERNIRYHTRTAIQDLNSALEDASKESDMDPVDAGTLQQLIIKAREDTQAVLRFLESSKGNPRVG